MKVSNPWHAHPRARARSILPFPLHGVMLVIGSVHVRAVRHLLNFNFLLLHKDNVLRQFLLFPVYSLKKSFQGCECFFSLLRGYSTK